MSIPLVFNNGGKQFICNYLESHEEERICRSIWEETPTKSDVGLCSALGSWFCYLTLYSHCWAWRLEDRVSEVSLNYTAGLKPAHTTWDPVSSRRGKHHHSVFLAYLRQPWIPTPACTEAAARERECAARFFPLNWTCSALLGSTRLSSAWLSFIRFS